MDGNGDRGLDVEGGLGRLGYRAHRVGLSEGQESDIAVDTLHLGDPLGVARVVEAQAAGLRG